MARAKVNSRDWSRIRLAFVGVVFAVIWLGLWTRAYYVQIVRGPALTEQVKRQHLAAEFEQGVRGEIFDRNGRLLAKSVRFTSVYAKPLEIDKPADAGRVLGKILEENPGKVAQRLSSKSNFVWIARQVGDRAAADIREANIQGIYLTSEYRRIYPNGSLAGQLLGFVGVDGNGMEGIERFMEPTLAAGKAEFVVQRDASGRKLFMDSEGREIDIDGKDVRLTIDANIQFATEEALARTVNRYSAKAGMCLVIKVATGEILAWANVPAFNPNDYKSFKASDWRNRIITDVYEPGSTMKPMLIAAALQEGVCNKDTLYFCEGGKWKVPNGFVIKDDKHKYEWLPVHKIIRYSSNIGAGKIGLSLGSSRYYSYLKALGLGERTNLNMPGESRGLLRPLHNWGEVDLITASFGQGVGVTALQLARAYLCIASGGLLKPLQLVQDPPQDSEGDKRVYSQKAASAVLAMLKEVVEEDGTGTMARIPGLNVGGKTGTAQKAKAGGGYGDKYLSSFIGLVPGENPEYLVMSVIDEPDQAHYGGVVAAPAVREVVIKTLAYLGKLPEPAADEEAASPAQPSPVVQAAVGPRQRPDKVEHPEKTERVEKVEKTDKVAKGEIPNVTGMTLRRAVEVLTAQGITPVLQGQGMFVTKQSPAPGEAADKGEKGDQGAFTIWLSNSANGGTGAGQS